MDTEILARLQFAVTIMFHYIYPPLSIGLGVVMVAMEAIYLKTGDEIYKRFAKFWTRIFALTFAMGVATGIVMEFEFGTNWSHYSRYVGDVFGSALAAEGVFAFFLESGFLSILLFGWDRVGPKLHFFATLMVCLGAHFSAIWIVVANAWMQTPAGFHIVGEGLAARAEIVDFWAMVFNPSSMIRLAHTVVGCWLAGAFLVISVSAYYFLKGRHPNFSRTSLKIGLGLAVVSCALQLYLGDLSAKIVAKYQPAKLAAMEGVYHTENGVPLYLFGVPNDAMQRVDYGIKLPDMLSYLTYGDFKAPIQGLDKIDRKDWPRVSLVFQSYHWMLYMWGAMVFFSCGAVFLWWRGTLFSSRWFMRGLVLSAIFPQIANQTGWMTAEVGRYPWIVYNLLRISDGLSKSVTAGQILGSLIMFTVVYIMLFALFVFLLDHKIKVGPTEEDPEPQYHNLDTYLKELEK
ncbi:MAG: cytochrome ubiquinol oxidase subunit I [Chlamydiales bacterium]|nr:cytochrome ubiquinol oxidase subunit I [Chlamydiales bacterium]